MKVRDLQRLGATLLVGAAVFAGGGCGEDGAGKAPIADVAEPVAVATEPARPAEPQTLQLLDGGNQTVYVKIGARLDLYDEPGGEVAETVGHSTEFGSRTVYSVVEQKGEWVGVLTPFTENGEPLWARLDPAVLRAGLSQWNIQVDLSDFEASLLRDGKVVRRFAVSVGMPTAPTPTGRFAVTDTFRGGLNDAYGCCAVALTARQGNLPSGWLGGDRIAIHGTDASLGAEVSHGCVRARDGDVSALVDQVPPGTPVEIRQ